MTTIRITAAILLGATLAHAELSAPLTRVTTGDVVNTPAWYWSSSWGDYDEDGYLDLFLATAGDYPRNLLYHNQRDGTFALVDEAVMPRVSSAQHGVAWADFDNDGHVDIAVSGGNGPGTLPVSNALYRSNGDGTFTAQTSDAWGQEASGASHKPEGIDYDGDGFLDIFLVGHTPLNRLFHNNGDGTFAKITAHVLTAFAEGAGTEGASWFDVNNDGLLDVLVSHLLVGGLPLYLNSGGENFVRTLSGIVSQGSITSPADYDNDGFLDVAVWGGSSDLFHNNGDGTFTAATGSGIVSVPTLFPGAGAWSFAWGDYDNDGFLDALVGVGCLPADSPSCQPTPGLLYHNDGDGTFTQVTDADFAGVTYHESVGASWADYDNDGFLDLVETDGGFYAAAQTAKLYHNDGNANAWLAVELRGTVSNRSGIGAVVRVHATYAGAPRWQMRIFQTGVGNQTLRANFGLGDATVIDTLRVEWPSGNVQELHDVVPRQLLTITEPPCGNGVLDPGEVCEGPCCDQCQAFRPAEAPCTSDDNLCTADVCDGAGSCAHVAAPDPGCAIPTMPGEAALALRRVPGDPSKSRLKFKWSSGPGVDRSDLGTSPAEGSPLYELCIYDTDGIGTTQAFRARARAAYQCDGRPCWKPLSDVGWKFASKSGAPDGLTGLVLGSGIAGKAKMKVTGKGAGLAMPDLPLVKSPAVIAQLRTSSGKCWGATFSSSLENDTLRFKSKAD